METITNRELFLFAINHAVLYERQIMPIIRNLADKVVKGTYEHIKAEKAFKHAADTAAQYYTREHGGTGHGSYGAFDLGTRIHVGREMAEYYAEDVAHDAAVRIGPASVSVAAHSFSHDTNGNPTAHYSVGARRMTGQRRQCGYSDDRMEGAGWAMKRAGAVPDWYRLDRSTLAGDRIRPAGINCEFRRLPIVVGPFTLTEPESWQADEHENMSNTPCVA